MAYQVSRVPLMEERMTPRPSLLLAATILAGGLAACTSSPTTVNTNPSGTFVNNPCAPTGTLTLAEAQSAQIDCSNGGATLTLAGNGASYLIVSQFPNNLVANQQVQYTMATGKLAR